MAMEEASNDQQEPTYYFYETTMGYHFRTLMDMYGKEDKSVLRYHDTQAGLVSPAAATQSWVNAITNIISFDVLSRTNLLSNLDYGAYASMSEVDFVPTDGLGRINTGNAILSKYPITDAERIQLRLRTDQDALVKYFYARRNIIKVNINISKI